MLEVVMQHVDERTAIVTSSIVLVSPSWTRRRRTRRKRDAARARSGGSAHRALRGSGARRSMRGPTTTSKRSPPTRRRAVEARTTRASRSPPTPEPPTVATTHARPPAGCAPEHQRRTTAKATGSRALSASRCSSSYCDAERPSRRSLRPPAASRTAGSSTRHGRPSPARSRVSAASSRDVVATVSISRWVGWRVEGD
jgi:hypothetical protein